MSNSRYSKQFPEVSGWYWMKGYGQHRAMPVEINGDLIFTSMVGQLHRRDLSESVEFAGPITVFDAERLIELRKAAAEARAFIESLRGDFDFTYSPVAAAQLKGTAASVVETLDAVLNPSHLQEEKGMRK